MKPTQKKPKADFELSYIYEAPAPAVFNALSTQVGIRGWWTECCVVATEVGAHAIERASHVAMTSVMAPAAISENSSQV